MLESASASVFASWENEALMLVESHSSLEVCTGEPKCTSTGLERGCGQVVFAGLNSQ